MAPTEDWVAKPERRWGCRLVPQTLMVTLTNRQIPIFAKI